MITCDEIHAWLAKLWLLFVGDGWRPFTHKCIWIWNSNFKLIPMTEQPCTIPKLELLLLVEDLLLAVAMDPLSGLVVWLSLLLVAEEEEDEGKEDAFVVVEEEEEEEKEEDLDEDEEVPLVQAALDRSPKGFRCAIPPLGADERAARSLCCCGPAAGSLGNPGRPPPPSSTGLHSAPTLAKVSTKTVPSTPAWTAASVSVQTLVSAKTLSSGRRLGGTCWSFDPAVSPVRGVAERTEGAAGSMGMTGRPTDTWWPPSAVRHEGQETGFNLELWTVFDSSAQRIRKDEVFSIIHVPMAYRLILNTHHENIPTVHTVHILFQFLSITHTHIHTLIQRD